MKRIYQRFLLQVCTACQNNCSVCVTREVRKKHPKYQLSLEQLKNFIKATEDSDYFIETLWLNGFGDPLLWKYLNEGIDLLSART